MTGTLTYEPTRAETAPEQEAQPIPTAGPIVVATDGTPSSDLAVGAAAKLARSAECDVQLVSVLEPLSSLAPAALLVGIPAGTDAMRVEERFGRIRDQRRLATGDSTAWSLEVKFGDPAPTIARLAKERKARLVVMGMNPHNAIDRVFGGDTVFDVVRLGESPVFVANRPVREAPRVLVVGVDFSDLSLYAARLALSAFPAATTLHLVHVALAPDGGFDAWYELNYEGFVRESFADLVGQLAAENVRIETVTLRGRPASELARFAGEIRADALVVGSYKRGLFRRLATGSMAARVLRRSGCPVLIVPAPTEDAASVGDDDQQVRHEALAAQLYSISERNSGRRTIVEVDNPAIGAQALAFDYTFLGAVYEPRDDRVELFLGDKARGSTRHVTHTIASPRSVEVLRGIDGRDKTVRIADGAGQALVTFW